MRYFVLCCLVLVSTFLAAAEHVIAANVETVDGDTINAKPGDIIRITAGNRESLTLRDLHGTADKPITVINQGGRVIVKTSTRGSALSIRASRFVRVTGTGDPASLYGFEAACTKSGSHSVNVIEKCSDIEIDHVEVSGAGFAGFNVKDEPKVDGSTNRGNYVMYNMQLHHNFVHDTGGEGFYIGHTFSNGWDHDNNPATPLLYPHFIIGLDVHHNITKNTGCEGIQVGSTIAGLRVHDNIVEDSGKTPFAQYQDNGIQIGNSVGAVYNNLVRNVPSAGLIIMTPGDVLISGNVIQNCGGDGIYIDDRASSEGSLATGGLAMGAGYRIINNTIIDPGTKGSSHGFALNANEVTTTNVVRNNVVIASHGHNWRFGSGTTVDQGGNLAFTTVAAALFVDAAHDNWHPRADSPLRNTGVAVANVGVTLDAEDLDRAAEGTPDVGAFEYRAGTATRPTAKNLALVLRGRCDAGVVALRVDGVPVQIDGQRKWTLSRPWPQAAMEVVLTIIASDGSETLRRVSLMSLARG